MDVKEIVEKIRLCPGYVLIKYIDLPEKYKGLVYFSPRHIDKRKASRKLRSWKGIVLKVTPPKTKEGRNIEIGFKCGDIVFFDEKSGIRYYDSDDMYLINKVKDVFAVFEDCDEEAVVIDDYGRILQRVHQNTAFMT